MSEEQNQSLPTEDASVAPNKQYLLMVDEVSLIFFRKICPTLQFLLVQGMIAKDNDTHLILVNPIEKPIPENEEFLKID